MSHDPAPLWSVRAGGEDWLHDHGIPLDPEGPAGQGWSDSERDELARRHPELFSELEDRSGTLPGA